MCRGYPQPPSQDFAFVVAIVDCRSVFLSTTAEFEKFVPQVLALLLESPSASKVCGDGGSPWNLQEFWCVRLLFRFFLEYKWATEAVNVVPDICWEALFCCRQQTVIMIVVTVMTLMTLMTLMTPSTALVWHLLWWGNQGAPPGLNVDVLDLHSKMRQKAAWLASLLSHKKSERSFNNPSFKDFQGHVTLVAYCLMRIHFQM